MPDCEAIADRHCDDLCGSSSEEVVIASHETAVSDCDCCSGEIVMDVHAGSQMTHHGDALHEATVGDPVGHPTDVVELHDGGSAAAKPPVTPASVEEPLPTLAEPPVGRPDAPGAILQSTTSADEVLMEESAAAPARPDAPGQILPSEEEPLEEAAPSTEPTAVVSEPAMKEPAVPAEPVPAVPATPAPAVEENLFDEPADKPAPAEPKAENDPFSTTGPLPIQPVRRWIDDTGLHETVGRLVEVQPDRIRILKANGRFALVPLSRLSRHDQNHIATQQSLAAKRAPADSLTQLNGG